MKLKVIISLLIVTIMFIGVFNICNCTEKSCNGCNVCRKCLGVGEKKLCPDNNPEGPTGNWVDDIEIETKDKNACVPYNINKFLRDRKLPENKGYGIYYSYSDEYNPPLNIATEVMFIKGKKIPKKTTLSLSYQGYYVHRYGIKNLVMMHYIPKIHDWEVLPSKNDIDNKIVTANISSEGFYTIATPELQDKIAPQISWLQPDENITLSGKVKLNTKATDNIGIDTVSYKLKAYKPGLNQLSSPFVCVSSVFETKDGTWKSEFDVNKVSYDGEIMAVPSGEYYIVAEARDLRPNYSYALRKVKIVTNVAKPDIKIKSIECKDGLFRITIESEYLKKNIYTYANVMLFCIKFGNNTEYGGLLLSSGKNMVLEGYIEENIHTKIITVTGEDIFGNTMSDSKDVDLFLEGPVED